METTLISYLPMFIMQIIYAILVGQIAKRRNKNAFAYVVASLIPFIGVFFFIYVMWSTILWMLDSINALKPRSSTIAE
jgi:cyanate permease